MATVSSSPTEKDRNHRTGPMQWVRPSVRATSSWWRHLGLSPWKYPGWENKFTCASKIPGVGHVHFLGSMTQFALYVSYVFAPSLSLMHLRFPPPSPPHVFIPTLLCLWLHLSLPPTPVLPPSLPPLQFEETERAAKGGSQVSGAGAQSSSWEAPAGA